MNNTTNTPLDNPVHLSTMAAMAAMLRMSASD
jgi:hypothetical protein